MRVNAEVGMETRGGNELSLDVLARLITLSAFLFIIITVISISIVRIPLTPGMCALMSYKNEGATLTLRRYSFLLSHFCSILYVTVITGWQELIKSI